MKAFSMGRFHKLVAVEGERVQGTFAVLLGQPGKPTYVKPFDVTVYDEGRHSGIVFYSGDMVGNVIDGVASIQERSIPESKRWDARDVWTELCDAVAAAVQIAEADRIERGTAMSAPQFVPGPHPSHDWHLFAGRGKVDGAGMCTRCQICTCHSPVASTEPCEYADTDQQVQAQEEKK